jgi:hypothetical protein
MIMKTMKRISLLMAVALLLSLNVNMNISDGKVKDLAIDPTPELAMADGQCWLRMDGSACICNMMVGIACAAYCIHDGEECGYYEGPKEP